MKTFFTNFENFFFRYFNLWDRASRAEYWCVMPVIWGLIIFAFIGDVFEIWDFLLQRQVPPLTPLYYESVMLFALTIIPRLSVTVRRLHDSGRSGRWAVLPMVAVKSSAMLILVLGSTMMMANSANLDSQTFASFGLLFLLFSGQFDTFWQALFGFVAVVNTIGFDVIWQTILSATQGMETPQAGVVVSNLGREIQQNPAEGGATTLVLLSMVLTPFVSTFLHLYFMLAPTERGHNSFGDSSAAPITGRPPTKPKHDVMQGYAHLFEKSPEQEAAHKQRQKEELKALYQTRVLRQANSG